MDDNRIICMGFLLATAICMLSAIFNFREGNRIMAALNVVSTAMLVVSGMLHLLKE